MRATRTICGCLLLIVGLFFVFEDPRTAPAGEPLPARLERGEEDEEQQDTLEAETDALAPTEPENDDTIEMSVGHVEGIVIDAVTERPLEGIEVQISDEELQEYTALTDEHGRFSFYGVPATDLHLVAEDSTRSDDVIVEVVEGTTIQTELRLAKYATLALDVSERGTGAFIASAEVELSDCITGDEVTAQTDRRGHVTVRVRQGEYFVNARRDSFRGEQIHLNLVSGETTTATLALARAAPLEIFVRDATGRPVVNAVVSLENIEDQVPTNTLGIADMGLVIPQAYEGVVQRDMRSGGTRFSVIVPDGESTHRHEVQLGGRKISGRLLIEGIPIADRIVYVRKRDGLFAGSTDTDESGAFTINELMPDEYTVTIDSVHEVDLRSGDAVLEENVSRSANIDGEIDNLPLMSLGCVCALLGTWENRVCTSTLLRKFELENLRPEVDYRLVAFADDCALADERKLTDTNAVVTHAGERNVRLLVKHSKRVRGTIRFVGGAPQDVRLLVNMAPVPIEGDTFEVDVSGVAVSLELIADGYPDQRRTVAFNSDGLAEAHFVVERGHALSGLVLDARTGAPVMAEISISGSGDEDEIAYADRDGRFASHHLQRGPYEVSIEADDYETWTGRVELDTKDEHLTRRLERKRRVAPDD